MDYLKRLRKGFPVETFPNTLRAIRDGIASGDDAIKGIPFLNTPIGRDYRGLIRRAGILHRFHDMCVAGDLPFKTTMSPMPRGSWHWLDISSDGVSAHIVRTEDADAFPEDTPNRQDQRERNMDDLFEDRQVVRLRQPALYSWLCFRTTPNGALGHALWQAPSAKREGKPDEWLARINILAEAVPKKSDDHARPGKVDPKTKMKLREKADEIQKKKKDKD